MLLHPQPDSAGQAMCACSLRRPQPAAAGAGRQGRRGPGLARVRTTGTARTKRRAGWVGTLTISASVVYSGNYHSIGEYLGAIGDFYAREKDC